MTLHCCRSVLEAAPEAEVIVADDGSTDGTAELLAREVPSVRVVRRATNGGFAAAANDGIRAARGDVILLLNSDAIVDREAPAALLRAFASDPQLGIASAQLFDPDGTPQWTGGRTPTLFWMFAAMTGLGRITRRFRRRGQTGLAPDWVSGAAMAFRRAVWNDAGPLAEHYRFYCQDIDFCLAARAHGWRIAIVPEARVTHLRGATAGRDRAILRDDLIAWGSARHGRVWKVVARVVLGGWGE
jgi:hypothetical protein